MACFYNRDFTNTDENIFIHKCAIRQFSNGSTVINGSDNTSNAGVYIRCIAGEYPNEYANFTNEQITLRKNTIIDGSLNVGDAAIGTFNGYAEFSHKNNFNKPNNYAIAQHPNGELILNAVTGERVVIKNNNYQEIAIFENNLVTLKQPTKIDDVGIIRKDPNYDYVQFGHYDKITQDSDFYGISNGSNGYLILNGHSGNNVQIRYEDSNTIAIFKEDLITLDKPTYITNNITITRPGGFPGLNFVETEGTNYWRFVGPGYMHYQHNSFLIQYNTNTVAQFTTGGNLRMDGIVSSNQFRVSSDDRVKHNELNIVNGLNIIRQLNPQKYQKTSTMYEENYVGDISGDWKWEAGLIAQDILAIDDLSYCVSGGDYIDSSNNNVQEKYFLNYNDIFVYGLAATKELDNLVQSQQEVINDLSLNYNSLKSENESLKLENELIKNALNELLVLAGKSTLA